MRNTFKILGALAVAGTVAAGGSAFTSANVVPASDAGAATTAISGFTVSAIRYNPDSTTPSNLASVQFTLDRAARYVAIQTHSAGAWFRSDDARLAGPANSCTTTTAGVSWTCVVTGATPNETVAAANSLTVVATN